MIETASRKIRISPELMATMLTRDHKGRRLTIDWGEPDDEGFYEPLITASDDAFSLGVVAAEVVIGRARALSQSLTNVYTDNLHNEMLIEEQWPLLEAQRELDEAIAGYENALSGVSETHRTTEGK